MYAIAGDRDMYKPLPVNDTPRSFYTVIRAFGLINEIAVPEMPDLALNPMFGLKLDATRANDLAGRPAIIGTLSNRLGVMIKLVALTPYGHWNFKPAADDMWAFLSRFRRECDDRRIAGRCHALTASDEPIRRAVARARSTRSIDPRHVAADELPAPLQVGSRPWHRQSARIADSVADAR